MSEYEGCVIKDIHFGKGSHSDTVYASLYDKNGSLLISATLNYIHKALEERMKLPSFRIPNTRYIEFGKEYASNDRYSKLRIGQAFHQFMQLGNCVQDKQWCDRLYEADGVDALKMIRSVIDYSC